jgi:ABC-type uncharacterized transport system auxiliary subunit
MNRIWGALAVAGAVVLLAGCAAVPTKRYYTLNYVPAPLEDRIRPGAYPFVVRVRDLSIEEAYARPQIVYRKSPFELEYYFFRVWAVKPARMVSDLIHKHLLASGLVNSVVRRYDEGTRPQFELGGTIEAIEEYDSEQLWFAHLALHLWMTRLADGKVVYSRRYDFRKPVMANRPDLVVKEMSMILEHTLNQLMRDLDAVFAREVGMESAPLPGPDADSTIEAPELWR